MPKFIKGIKLNQLFYEQVVKPVINKRFQQLKYSAALIGHGSEVLGYDDITSTDHSWGTRLLLFLSEKDYRKYNKTIHKTLQEELPHKFLDGLQTIRGSIRILGYCKIYPKER